MEDVDAYKQSLILAYKFPVSALWRLTLPLKLSQTTLCSC